MLAALPDPSRCPLCGGPNGCAMHEQRELCRTQEPCWCTRATFTAEVLARVPEPARDRACICAACAASPAR